jgi:hypothetical protein
MPQKYIKTILRKNQKIKNNQNSYLQIIDKYALNFKGN